MSEAAVKGLTLTWDVLKPEHGNDAELQLLINFNMGCIETDPSSPSPEVRLD